MRNSRFLGRLALLVLLVCGKLAYDLVVAPRDPYSISVT